LRLGRGEEHRRGARVGQREERRTFRPDGIENDLHVLDPRLPAERLVGRERV
jgi:hypothetical protein